MRGILQVVSDGLCHRCGACVGVCPVGALKLDANGWPRAGAACVECDRCTLVCPGANVDFLSIGQRLYGADYRYGEPLGAFRSTCLACAANEEVRWSGASGGVATQVLIHLLDRRRIGGALVAVGDPADPCMGKGLVARSREQILAAAQSRYTTTPSLAALSEIIRNEGSYAVVGLPCQIHAIRMAEQEGMPWAGRIQLLIGLFCYRNLPALASRELGALITPRGKKIAEIQYRQSDQKGWPYNTIEVRFTDGSAWRSPYPPNETVSLLSRLYSLKRCRTCLDVTAEFADLALGDPWIRDREGKWKYSEPAGFSSVIVRTRRGQAALDEAVSAGAISVRPLEPGEIAEGQATVVYSKKKLVPLRLKLDKWFGWRVPMYWIPLPRPTFRAFLHEVLAVPTRLVAAMGPLRRLALRLGFSRLGRIVMRLRMEQKRRRAVRRMLPLILSACMPLGVAGLTEACFEESCPLAECLEEMELFDLSYRKRIT
ncbi:MAG: Coenzyme F420 hydrogenase/dehydrogenase, beta subunit C-terminal domain [Kiritimatiellae bacterium]|nr:Coenzyme F420 hydrogenase/dehydrogenase, beta subunit C-terminal domain [Kiritimatiellia bacterium]